MKESHPRATIQYDHCGFNIIRHDVKVHTQRHHPESVMRDRIKRQLPVSGFFISKKLKKGWHTVSVLGWDKGYSFCAWFNKKI